MTVEEIAFANYQSLTAFDQEIRDQDPRFANMDIDDGLVGDLRAGIAGRLDDNALEGLIGHRIEWFRLRGNTDAVKGTSKWRKLAIALCASEYEVLARQVERDDGNFNGEPEHPLIANAAPPADKRALLEGYLKELERNGRGREARKRWTPVFEDLAQFIGHNDASRITKQDLMDWRDAKLEALSPKTVADVYMASVRAVLTWAAANDRLHSAPAEGVKVKKTKRIQIRERGFRDDEATMILQACRNYMPVAPDNPANREAPQTSAAKRWASLLCAFTGARIVEITQLRKQDMREERGVTIVRITPEVGSVKTGQYRDVPLHQQVIDLGFVDFVKTAPDGPLFHAAKPERALQGARTTSGRVSQWLQAQGMVPDGVKPNHGWRYSRSCRSY